jgi:hypothetical protein
MSKGMKKIPLTQGKVAVVDEEDYAELLKHKWYASQGGRTTYAKRDVRKNDSRQTIYMHREIMSPLPSLQIHHINHNGLDNRKSNLCICTQSQNSQSKIPQTSGASQYKGVYRHKNNGKWRSAITHNKKRFYLGVFSSQVQAAKAYDDKAFELFGDFAYPNFPHRLERRNIRKWLAATAGRVFAVTFIRRCDGREKTILARTGVRVNQKGKKLGYNLRGKKLVLLFDMAERKYKCIPIEGIEAVTYRKKHYRVD